MKTCELYNKEHLHLAVSHQYTGAAQMEQGTQVMWASPAHLYRKPTHYSSSGFGCRWVSAL